VSDALEITLARAWAGMRFGPNVAVRVAGQRVTLDREGPEVATVLRAWVTDDGREIRAEVEFDHTAIGEAAKGIVAEGQASLFD
jgi:hypothetical protein